MKERKEVLRIIENTGTYEVQRITAELLLDIRELLLETLNK